MFLAFLLSHEQLNEFDGFWIHAELHPSCFDMHATEVLKCLPADRSKRKVANHRIVGRFRG